MPQRVITLMTTYREAVRRAEEFPTEQHTHDLEIARDQLDAFMANALGMTLAEFHEHGGAV